jgi:hypothetical protein
MSNWIREHFQDADHARETTAIVGFVIGALGALTTLIALTFPHWSAFFR